MKKSKIKSKNSESELYAITFSILSVDVTLSASRRVSVEAFARILRLTFRMTPF